jgi:DNA-binding transcriptional ArsR family regulator
MRKKTSSEALLFPHTRQRVLATLLLHPKKEWYLSELARMLKSAPAHLHRELTLFEAAGVLRRRVEGRQVYYSPDPNCPYLPELTALVRKTMGFNVVLSTVLKPLAAKIRCAFIYGSIAKKQEKSGGDVDLMVVGDLILSDLVPALTRAEHELGRPVNATVYPQKELVKKYREGNHFVRAVVADPAKTFIIGTSHDLEKAANGRTDKTAHVQQSRARRAPRRR